MGRGLFRTLLVGLIALTALAIFQGCQRSSSYYSALGPSAAAQWANLASGSGNGLPFEGGIARYIYRDPAHPCSSLGGDGLPIPNAEIDIVNQSAQLVSTGCAILNPPQPLATSQIQSTNDGTGDILYDGLRFVPEAFYVSPSGSDANSGTSPSSPFATLAKAQSAMQGSSTKTTYVRAGTYSLGSTLNLGSTDSGETWSYYPPDGVNTAVLDGGGALSPMINLANVSNTTINGLKLQHFAAIGILLGGATGMTDNHNTFENCDIGSSTTAPPVQDASATGGIVVWASPTSQDNTIKNNYIHDLGGLAILAGAWTNYGVANGIDGTVISGNMVERVDLLSSNNGGISVTMAQTGDNAGHVTITNNFVRNWGASGYSTLQAIYLDDNSSNVTIAGNLIGPANPGATSVSDVFVHNGNDNAISGNLFDLGPSGSVSVVTYGVDSNSLAGLAGNSVTSNIVISGYSGSGTTAYGGQSGSPASDYTIQNNDYFNYAGGAINTSGNVMGDTSPVNENPEISGWLYTIATGSPVFNSPVNFPPLVGSFGPPGFTVSQSGTPPSSPH